jgi:long-chain acyl-CoA synthetase
MPPAGVFGQGERLGFRWHESARLVGPDGLAPQRSAAFARVLPDRPGGASLVAALSGGGAGFRIGGAGGLVAQDGYFETMTGGSLGGARRVVRTQGSWCASFAVNARLFGIGPSVRVAVPGRLSHSLALYAALEGLCLGAEVHLLDGLRPDRMARAIAERRIEVIYATPVHLAQMVAVAPVWPALRLVLVGGAKLEQGLRSALAAAAPSARVHEFYGAAETSFITLTGQDPLVPDGPETVGRPYPGVELRILGPEGNTMAAGETGMVWVRSPYLFEDYSGADRGSARWRDGWLSVGEIGAMTAGGLVLRGRSGRMVTIAGQNVFAEEVERFLGTLPGVERVAVLALPDGLRGHVLCAVAMGDRSQEAAILGAARARLGALVAPRRMFWRQHWPMLASGKTDLAALQAEVAAWR